MDIFQFMSESQLLTAFLASISGITTYGCTCKACEKHNPKKDDHNGEDK